LQEGVDEVAVGGVQFDAVETRRLRARSGLAVVFDDSRDLGYIQRPMRRRLDPPAVR